MKTNFRICKVCHRLYVKEVMKCKRCNLPTYEESPPLIKDDDDKTKIRNMMKGRK